MRNWLRRLLARSSPPPASYRQLIAPLPIPTAEQTESFADYVVGAHSWYKHLPCERAELRRALHRVRSLLAPGE